MKTTKPVTDLIIVAVILAATTTTFGASVADDSAVIPTRPSCCSQSSGSVTNSVAKLSAGTNAEAAISIECDNEVTSHVDSFTTQPVALTKVTNPIKRDGAVSYFSEAVISVGKADKNSELQEREISALGAAQFGRSFAGREETREPRGLRLFSWRW